MADPRTPDPRHPDPRHNDPVYEDRLHGRPSHTDPLADPAIDPALQRANDPLLADRPIQTSGRGGLVAAGVIAVLVVIAVIAFSSGTTTDPGTTAVIPDQTQETMPQETMPAPETVPTEPAPETAPAQPFETAPAPAE